MTSAPPPSIYRYATPRQAGEGLRIGVTRHVPRGVRREDRQRLGYFDLWLPMLGPSPALLKEYRGGGLIWAAFARRYRKEMRQPACQQVIELLATFSHTTPFVLGCYCGDETRCHRSLLLPLVLEARQASPETPERRSFASPPCYLAELADEH
ncbi:MAG: DUF488 domain-containing protein [Prosthecobacter sp.]